MAAQEVKKFPPNLLRSVEGRVFEPDPLPFHTVTLDMLRADCLELAFRIQESGIAPDSIIGIEKGGLVPFAFVSDLVAARKLGTMQIKRTVTGKVGELGPPVLVKPINIDVTGDVVVIVDDISDEGDSFRLAVEHAQERGAKSVYTAAPYIKPRAQGVADFAVWLTRSWVLFPFDIRENVEKLTERWLEQGVSQETVVERLRSVGLPGEAIGRFAPSLFQTLTPQVDLG